MIPKIPLQILAAAALLGHADAFWRTGCSKLELGRIDPIVQPGVVSNHVHTVLGASSKIFIEKYRTIADDF
jgi:Domain of unknown function (DUF1996)